MLILANYALALILFIASSFLGYALTPHMPGVESIVKGFEELVQNVQAEGAFAIFRHNLPLGLVMAIPFLGYGLFMLIISMTGFVLGTYAYVVKHTIWALFYSILASMFLPHGILEILAYSIFASASLYATKAILRKSLGIRQFAIYTALIAISSALLFAAAFVEYYEIRLLQALH